MAKNVEAFSQEERFNYIKAVSILPDFERDAFDVYEKLINQPLTIFEAAHILSDIRFRCGERYVSIAGKINSKHPELHGLIAFVIYDLDPKSSVEYLETTLAKEIDSIKEGGTPRSDYLRSLERRLFEARLSRIGD